jgi:hypothetical protein
MKLHILDDICAKLNEMQIPYSTKDTSHLTVSTEFYEVGYGIESKKIMYDLTVYLDEAQESVFMYVNTGDQNLTSGSGNDNVTSWPSASLFRTVKHICLDKNGTPAIITINLGDIPNTIKSTAFKYGWKFRTALSMKSSGKNTARSGNPPVEQKAEATLPAESNETETGSVPVPDATPEAGTKKKGLLKRLFNK